MPGLKDRKVETLGDELAGKTLHYILDTDITAAQAARDLGITNALVAGILERGSETLLCRLSKRRIKKFFDERG